MLSYCKTTPGPPVNMPPNSELLLEFLAGRMICHGTTVRPDTRKGLIRLVKTEDHLVHFQWMTRDGLCIDEDQIVFPDEAYVEAVSQSSGRVYLLRFREDSRRFFFWMQEAVDRDALLINNLNGLLQYPSWVSPNDDDEEMPSSDSDPEHAAEGSDRDEDDSVLGVATQEYVRGEEATSAPPVIPPVEPPGSGVEELAESQARQLSELQSILSGLSQISVPQGLAGEVSSQAEGEGVASLVELLRPEVMLPWLANPSVQERLAHLLPEALRSPAAMSDLVQSPQFRQQLDAMSTVLGQGRLDLRQFGIDDAKYAFSVASFLQAIEDQTRAEGLGDVTSGAPADTVGSTGGSTQQVPPLAKATSGGEASAGEAHHRPQQQQQSEAQEQEAMVEEGQLGKKARTSREDGDDAMDGNER